MSNTCSFIQCLHLDLIALKKHHDHSISYKGKYIIGTDLQFLGSVHYHISRKHGNMQADVVLEKELVVVLLDLLAEDGDCPTKPSMNISGLKAHLHSYTLIRQGHTC